MMLAFIFVGGWGNVKKRYAGSVGVHRCPMCERATEWQVYEIRKRATVYFVPVWTYGSQKIVMCSACGAGREVSDAEIAELNQHRNPGDGQQAAGSAASGAAASRPFSSGSSGGFMGWVTKAIGEALRQEDERWKAEMKHLLAEARKARGPRARARGVRIRRSNPALADWYDRLVSSLASYGYLEDERIWGEISRGFLIIVSGSFMVGSTLCMVAVFQTPHDAAQYVPVFLDRTHGTVAQEKGWLQVVALDRLMFMAWDRGGLQAGGFGRWMQAVRQTPLPDTTPLA